MLQPELTVLVLRSDEALLVTISSIRTDPTDPWESVVSELIQLIQRVSGIRTDPADPESQWYQN